MTAIASPIKAQPKMVALFVSDVHLCATLPVTTNYFLDFLKSYAIHSARVYLLGDLFEYWAGDDDISDPYNQKIVSALHELVNSGVAVYWIAGNRDFLIGQHFASATGITLLEDPTVLQIADKQILLTHGDAQCTEDHAYIKFRAQVRRPEWQEEFLTLPLAQRKSIIEGMRKQSRTSQAEKYTELIDVTAAEIEKLFENHGVSIVIHGHTHQPAMHVHKNGVRYVLPDWDCDTFPPRGGWLALRDDGSITSFGHGGDEKSLDPV